MIPFKILQSSLYDEVNHLTGEVVHVCCGSLRNNGAPVIVRWRGQIPGGWSAYLGRGVLCGLQPVLGGVE